MIMIKKMLTGLCGVMLSLAIGGCDEEALLAEEAALADRDEASDEDEDAEPRISIDPELDDLAAPVRPAADDCSDQYIEHSFAYHACGTCPNGRVNNIMKRTCWGTGAWCPKECGSWEPYYSPCVPCS
ncbi:hypothetical protein [Nannocystis sp. SCPEA4]|uniref:hypothetical protein n=1 Tax=Nannocystis sp. SCPEA4 TaxID=2996787 RepID=UPI00227030B3|nr:hypothetical protein [Nannocystis sp. SCPEA4]